jgi:hypothetical protein
VAEDGCVVLGDEEIVQPILINLVDNAYRHGAPPVTIRVERDGDRVVMSVEDRGPGVPPERRETVFAGLPPAGAPQGPRAGAGLSIVRGVVAALRGTVWVDDVPGGGAAFRIAFPLDEPGWTPAADTGQLQVLEEGVGVHHEPDDDPPERDFVTAASELSALALGDDEPGGMTGMGAWAMPGASAPPSAPAPPPMPG